MMKYHFDNHQKNNHPEHIKKYRSVVEETEIEDGNCTLECNERNDLKQKKGLYFNDDCCKKCCRNNEREKNNDSTYFKRYKEESMNICNCICHNNFLNTDKEYRANKSPCYKGIDKAVNTTYDKSGFKLPDEQKTFDMKGPFKQNKFTSTSYFKEGIKENKQPSNESKLSIELEMLHKSTSTEGIYDKKFHKNYKSSPSYVERRKYPPLSKWQCSYDNKNFIKSKVNEPLRMHANSDSPSFRWEVSYDNKNFVKSQINTNKGAHRDEDYVPSRTFIIYEQGNEIEGIDKEGKQYKYLRKNSPKKTFPFLEECEDYYESKPTKYYSNKYCNTCYCDNKKTVPDNTCNYQKKGRFPKESLKDINKFNQTDFETIVRKTNYCKNCDKNIENKQDIKSNDNWMNSNCTCAEALCQEQQFCCVHPRVNYRRGNLLSDLEKQHSNTYRRYEIPSNSDWKIVKKKISNKNFFDSKKNEDFINTYKSNVHECEYSYESDEKDDDRDQRKKNCVRKNKRHSRKSSTLCVHFDPEVRNKR